MERALAPTSGTDGNGFQEFINEPTTNTRAGRRTVSISVLVSSSRAPLLTESNGWPVARASCYSVLRSCWFVHKNKIIVDGGGDGGEEETNFQATRLEVVVLVMMLEARMPPSTSKP